VLIEAALPLPPGYPSFSYRFGNTKLAPANSHTEQ
jgi:hypothetical protein